MSILLKVLIFLIVASAYFISTSSSDPGLNPFSIFNTLINSKEKINNLFDIIINETKIDEEIKNLIIYKKDLYNSDFESSDNLLNILNPIINSDSIWKSHALYLLGEYYLSKNEKQKSKEFFEKILTLENSNPEIRLQIEKKIRRDLSE